MLTNIRSKGTEELYATPILQQTAFWSAVKRTLGAEAIAINFSSRRSGMYSVSGKDSDYVIKSDVLVILQQIDRNHSVAYVPYGPEIEPDDEFQGLFLEELSECLRSFYLKSVFSSDTTCAGNRIGQKRKIISMRTVCGKVNLKSIHRSCVSTSTRTTGISKKSLFQYLAGKYYLSGSDTRC